MSVLHFSDDTLAFLKTVQTKQLQPDEESEFRFHAALNTQYMKGIKYEQYLDLDIDSGDSSKLSKTEDTVYIKGNYRKIESSDGKIVYQKKTRLSERKINMNKFQIKYSHSKEEVISKREIEMMQNDYDIQRKRTRESVNILDSFRLDKTKVVSYDYKTKKQEITFEFEIEILKPNDHLIELLNTCASMLESVMFIYELKNNKIFDQVERDTMKIKEILLELKEPKNNPVNISIADIRKLSNYSVTNKLNGEFARLVTGLDYIYILGNRAFERNKSDKPNYNYINILSENTKKGEVSILDCEFFREKAYVWDCIYFKNKSIIKKHHYSPGKDGRYDCAVTISNEYRDIKMKKFFFDNIYENTVNCIKYMQDTFKDKMRIMNDGMIYTPMYQEYPQRNFNKIYKWKFKEHETIDFMYFPRRGGGYELNVSGQGRVFFKFDNNNKLRQAILSSEKLKSRANLLNGMPDAVYDGKDGGIYDFKIVETALVNGKYKPYRIRYDKQKPNFLDTSYDVYTYMINPILEGNLVNQMSNTVLRDYHNHIKKMLINEYSTGKRVLDIGVGRGGDLSKYKFSNVKKLYGIEPFPDNLRECENRYSKMENKPPAVFKQLKGENTKEVLEFIKEKVNVVFMFFVLTFFFENETMLDKLLDTVTESTSEYFVGTIMDGDRAVNYIESSDSKDSSKSSSSITIKKDYTTRQDFGNKIIINMEGETSIYSNQVEYLTSYNVLSRKLKQRGFTEIKKEFFNPEKEYATNSKDAQFSKCNYYFVFKKESKESKQDKKEKQENSLPSNQTLKDIIENVNKKSIYVCSDTKLTDIEKLYDENIIVYTINSISVFYKADAYANALVIYRMLYRDRNRHQSKELIDSHINVINSINNFDKSKLAINNEIEKLFDRLLSWLYWNGDLIVEKYYAINSSKLDVDEIEDFNKLSIIGINNAVRIGTIGEGSCAIHSILRGVYKEYEDLNTKERKKIAYKVREILSKKFTIQDWIRYKGYTTMEKLPKKLNNPSIEQAEKILIDYSNGKSSKEVKEVLDEYFENYKSKIEKCSAHLDKEEIDYIANVINFNIIIINVESGFLSLRTDVYDRPSIVIVHVGGNHFELIGRRNEKGKITTIFNIDDQLIKNLECMSSNVSDYLAESTTLEEVINKRST